MNFSTTIKTFAGRIISARFCAILLLLCLCAPGIVHAVKTGTAAPDFTLRDPHGKKIALSEFRGKVLLLNFWATNCGPCKAEMPSLNNLYLALKDKGLVVLAVSLDTSEKPVLSFISANKTAFTVLMDPDKEVYFDTYALFGLPITLLIDKNGIVAEKFIGETAWDSPAIKEKVMRLLNGKQHTASQ